MKVKITGINGYLGKIISERLIAKHYDVSGIKRERLYGPLPDLEKEISGCDVIINLAGASILRRWTNKNKKLIYDSRIKTTRNLVQAINNLKAEHRPKKFISASAIGIYKTGFLHDEKSTNFDEGFIGKTVLGWEGALNHLPETIQKNIFRIGLVLGKQSKSIQNLHTPFNFCLGGKIGSGNQSFPFIHEKDLVNAFVWAVNDLQQSKTYNLVAPQNISNANFTKAFAKHLNRPAFIPVPKFVLKLALGEASSMLLENPIVEPKALIDSGFTFEYPTIDSALLEILA